ncbi:putative peptidase domain-containing protein [Emericellopsis atlantica]|uniref:Peptidase domain-containing protein n=1 Tax=Emericellopsis atlantica TaxID=2614577 RepID=A0A9P8CNQ2_9HYPO|nr:putative peptidase domain-containing protein [Emericellopsis atlantica]KAG9254024.1 putative peptidase domain-containing protein [Emericellopsis atlantica]
MMYRVALLLAAATASASPLVPREAPTSILPSGPETSGESKSVYNWSEGWETKYPIHESCNATKHAALEFALDETMQLAQHARDHLLRFGDKSDLVKKYFGNSSTAVPIGWFDRVVSADKSAMTFRCDDPDKNCATQDAWAGHWRGDNATQETVICDLSFQIRKNLFDVCAHGFTVANSALNTYWAVDLLHRVLHVPAISEELVHHYAEDYNDALRLAKEEPELTGYDSDILQMFAIDAWAYDIAVPGAGCTGTQEETEDEDEETSTATTTSASPTATGDDADDGDAGGENCHTHADGTAHCT